LTRIIYQLFIYYILAQLKEIDNIMEKIQYMINLLLLNIYSCWTNWNWCLYLPWFLTL